MVSEEKIKKEITKEFSKDERVNAKYINIIVNNQEIILEGTVPDYTDKIAASNIAQSIRNVISVENRLNVKFPPMITPKEDQIIEGEVNELINLNHHIKEEDIQPIGTNGVVTLEGSVDQYWKKIRAEQIIENVSGIIDIINKIAVVPTDNIKDEAIANNIVSAITRNANVSVDNISVLVNNGKVKLNGTVKNWTAHEVALDAVQLTAGVKEIIDQLTIG